MRSRASSSTAWRRIGRPLAFGLGVAAGLAGCGSGNANVDHPEISVGLTADPVGGQAALAVEFHATITLLAVGDEIKYQWDLDGDQTFEVEGSSDASLLETVPPTWARQQHTFGMPGTYVVTFTAQLDDTTIERRAVAIIVTAPPATGNPLANLSDVVYAQKFVVGTGDNYQLSAINPDGTGLERATDNAFRDRAPSWSPEGTRLLFASNRHGAGVDSYDFYVAEGTIENVRRITHENDFGRNAREGSWSPDSTRIAYRAGGDIWAVDIAPGSTAVRLTDTPSADIDDSYPSYSQDGTRIAFVRRDLANGANELWIMNSDGSGGAKVLDSVVAAAWSPDPAAGRRIAVATVFLTLKVLEDDGTLAPFGDGAAPAGENIAWSPDGDAILMHNGGQGLPPGAPLRIAVVRESSTEFLTVGEAGDVIEGVTWRRPPP